MFWPDNIVELFQKFGVLKHFDFLSVDMDSYDWFTLEKVLEAGFEPRVIIMECNTMFDLEDSKAILPPILPGQTWKMWDGTTYQVGGQLSLVEARRDCALIGWIIMFLLPALFCVIKTQLKAAFLCVFMA